MVYIGTEESECQFERDLEKFEELELYVIIALYVLKTTYDK